jgi:hypothetical protein
MNRSLPFVAVALALMLAPSATAQKLYGYDGPAGVVFEYTMLPGAPCGQPVPTVTTWPVLVPPPCAGPPLMPTAPPGPVSFGDIAANSRTDTVLVCDGISIMEFAEFSPLTFTPPGTPINSFPIPLVTGALVTGLGMDELGLFTGGAPTLWLTDGFAIWGIVPSPPGSCAPVPIAVPPFVTPFPTPPGVILTDVTWDPSTGTLLACDSGGFVHSIVPGGGPGPYGFFPVAGAAGCGLMPFLEGIAMDLATTPSALGSIPAFYVTDGFMNAYLDVTGAPAAPTFYTPMTCNPSVGPQNGIAYVNHSINFGAPPGAATLTTFGQPSSPGPTYGLTITSPAPSFAWVVYGVNIPGPGFFCPPAFAVGNPLYVDPFTPPGAFFALVGLPAGATSLPAPIPAGLFPGVEAYVQVFLDLSPGAPGGPWLSTDAIDLVVTAP